MRQPQLRPVPTDDRLALLCGTGLWLAALAVGWLARDDLERDGRGWWLWVCVAGIALGAAGVAYLHSRDRRILSRGAGQPVHDESADRDR